MTRFVRLYRDKRGVTLHAVLHVIGFHASSAYTVVEWYPGARSLDGDEKELTEVAVFPYGETGQADAKAKAFKVARDGAAGK